MRTVRVEASSRAYRVYVGPGIIRSLDALLTENGITGRCLVVTDEKVAELHLQRLLTALNNSPVDVAGTLVLGRGERTKTLASVRKVYRTLLEGGFHRDGLVINLSGGMLGDLSGFAAATFMRGMRWVQVPTTLLAQVDASVGGKVGVNLPQGKNLVGAFYQPWMVVCDVSTLMTLPPRSFRAGLAEVVKMAVTLDEGMVAFMEKNAARVLAGDPDVLAEMVQRSVELKAAVVAEDEQEQGRRMVLNYGHTLGHALEKASGYRSLLHGEAVSLGMCAAAELAQELGLMTADAVRRQRRLLEKLRLPINLSQRPGLKVSPDEVLSAMGADKKHRRGRLNLVLPAGIGRVIVKDDVPADTVNRVFDRFIEQD